MRKIKFYTLSVAVAVAILWLFAHAAAFVIFMLGSYIIVTNYSNDYRLSLIIIGAGLWTWGYCNVRLNELLD